ncbi:hypothetical protein JZ751_011898 [Albula glossodonta]|uniref:Secreted protein n=1 Tax=Albula glossodonta TaxID=121402 RepID=A0A8T2PQZ1_9TELE|nr:hypothetical protein JZ751_011898 [Albula glossodonta]
MWCLLITVPAALLICSSFCPSEARIWACFLPSATLIAASLVPSDSRTVALFFRSASTSLSGHTPLTCICMDSLTRGGTWMSLISYRRQRIPHSSDAWLMECTITTVFMGRLDDHLCWTGAVHWDGIVRREC